MEASMRRDVLTIVATAGTGLLFAPWAVRAAAKGTDNLLYPMKEALRAGATLGEVSDTLRTVFGEYRPGQ